jgi:tetratricopeptide (TPR) repeat protein
MRTAKRAFAFVIALVIALALGACGQGGGQGADGGQFQGFDARSVDELANLAEAAMAEAKLIDKEDADSQQKAKASTEFENGNTEYRARNYAKATEAYKEALEYDRGNHGANVNLTLSLLQEGRDNEAFAQALRCVALFPDDAGCLLNAQVAGTACRFSAVDLDIWLDLIVNERGDTSVSAVLTPTLKGTGNNMIWNDAYAYNAIWNRIETELYQGEKTAQNAVEIAPVDAYLEMKESLIGLNPDDADVAGLQAYLEAVAQQLDLNKEQ